VALAESYILSIAVSLGAGCLTLAACTPAPKPYPHEGHFTLVQIEDVPDLPRVLLIGDSISMWYTLGVRQRLEGRANVHRPHRNCRSTQQTLAELEGYLGRGQWDVIHFNCGIHDLTHLNESGEPLPPPMGKPQVPLEQYRKNLRLLLDRLERTGARLIWASTTPVGPGAQYRFNSDVIAYNGVAAELMRDRGVWINDLYAVVEPRAGELLADGVHLTPGGSEILADAVATTIAQQLSR